MKGVDVCQASMRSPLSPYLYPSLSRYRVGAASDLYLCPAGSAEPEHPIPVLGAGQEVPFADDSGADT